MSTKEGRRFQILDLVEAADAQLTELLRLALPLARRRKLSLLQFELRQFKLSMEQRYTIAFIGYQKTGKSSVINAILDGMNLPTGQNGLDQFVTRITTIENLEPEFRTAGVVARLLRNRKTTELSQQELDELFLNLRNTTNPTEYSDVEELTIFHPDPRLKHVDILNTPGIYSALPHTQAAIARVAKEAHVLFWVFQLRGGGLENEKVASSIQSVLGGRKRRAIALLNKCENTSPMEREEAVGVIRERFGRLVDSDRVVAYSARAVAAAEMTAEARAFSEELQYVLEEVIALSTTKKEALKERQRRLLEICTACYRNLSDEMGEIEKRTPPGEIRPAEITAHTIIPIVDKERAAMFDLAHDYTRRIAGEQIPIFEEIITEYIGIIPATKYGIAGIFSDKCKLSYVISKKIEGKMDAAPKRAAILRHQEALFEEYQDRLFNMHTILQVRLERDLSGVVTQAPGNPGIAPEPVHVGTPDIATELLKSLMKAMAMLSKKMMEKCLQEISERILARLAEKAAVKTTEKALEKATEAVAEKATQAAIQKAAEKATEKAAEEAAKAAGRKAMASALSAALADILTFWMLITLPADILDIVKLFEESKKEALEQVREKLMDNARRSAEQYADVLCAGLSRYKREISDELRRALVGDSGAAKIAQAIKAAQVQMRELIDELEEV